ncbi:membrane protein insertion efficiency factor YidD [Streptacidiphilus monticola]|uniref:Putative membrane protein insertion efficiency factor n=1 Tax=Streptacidiphilus monticola TaxID=2161674 RepID=A0ABW1G076_9ACTN
MLVLGIGLAALFAGKYVLLALIRIYQWTISPLLGPVCKYHPSCSRYGFEAVRVHGALKGSVLTAWRILRCNPWSVGGVDYVPARKHPVWYQRVRPHNNPGRATTGEPAASSPTAHQGA